ncbi:MAG: trypsin-like peptidase domain-containing protein [Deltaproteobacteria bacterium]|nr:trypsin-like peptidase domain-containing protein [Deltaproteobacteria bacterium]
MDDRAVARVWFGKPNAGGTYLGTAFLVSPDCLLTAHHVIENRPVSEIYLQGQAWSGIRNLRDALCHDNPDIDVAILYLTKKEDRPIFLPLAPEQDADTGTGVGATVTLAGFGTEYSDLEKIEATISSYDGNCDLTVAHTSIARGMSGGPVLANGRVVGLIRARHHDSNKTYLVRLNSFRDFLMQSGCLPDRPPLKGPAAVITPDEFVARIRGKIQAELRRKPLTALAAILKQKVSEAAGPDAETSAWLCQGDLVESVDLLHEATKECLAKLADDGVREDALQAMWQGAVNVLGWLVLLSVDHEWVRQHGSSLTNGNAEVRFVVPCSTGAGLETLVARIGAKEPARFTFDPGGAEVIGQHRISGSAVEAGWDIGSCAEEIKKRIYRRIHNATPPHPFTQQHTKELNAILKRKGSRGENHYLSIPVTEENNPLQDPEVYQMLMQELTGLRLVYFGTGDGEGVLLLSEVDLFALVYEFLQLIKEYQ